MEALVYIWIACVIVNILFFITVDEVLYKEIHKLDNKRFTDNPDYERKCYLISIGIICISGPIGSIIILSR